MRFELDLEPETAKKLISLLYDTADNVSFVNEEEGNKISAIADQFNSQLSQKKDCCIKCGT